MVSHALGQGYPDLHFLIPEVVSRVEVRKGPYDARDGDHATAAADEFRTLDRLPGGVGTARVGSFRTGHVTALVPIGGNASQPGGLPRRGRSHERRAIPSAAGSPQVQSL
jgi:hypothetical protein